MIRRSLVGLLALAAALAAALAVAPAWAQIQLGASVPSFIALSIGTPTGLARVRGGGAGSSYELRVPVAVTATDNGARLSIADGEDLEAPARGHLRDGSSLVAAPLEVVAAGGPAQPLSAPADPLLETWSRPVSNAPLTIALRQSLPPGAASAVARLHKTVLITLSSQTP